MARLKDGEELGWDKIEKQLGINKSTAARAWRYYHRDRLRELAERGETIPAAKYTHLGNVKKQQIRDLIRQGLTPKDIATSAGCGESTVRRLMYDLRTNEEAGD